MIGRHDSTVMEYPEKHDKAIKLAVENGAGNS
jgi:hypothetical protein